MLNLIVIGTLGGLVFGIIFIWEGVGAAGIVLGFTVLGLLIGIVLQFLQRIIFGDIDTGSLRELMSTVVSGRRGE